MTESYKNLAQSHPSAMNLVSAYTCSSKAAVISTIIVSNTSGNNGGSPDFFRVSHAINAAADNIAQYLLYDIQINQMDTYMATVGPTLSQGDVIRVYSQNGTCSFNIYGVELN